MTATTLSRSMSRWAFVDAVCGSSGVLGDELDLRPAIPPAALISSTASVTPITAYSPSGPRNPVRGVRMAQPHGVGLAAHDRREADRVSQRAGSAAGAYESDRGRNSTSVGP